MNHKSILEHSIHAISDFITEDNLKSFRKEKCFVRKRLLSLLQVCVYLLYSSRASMFQNIACIRQDFPVLSFPDISKQALSKSRQGILPEFFRELFRITSDTFYSMASEHKNWNGYKIFAIDGSKIEIGNSKSNFEKYGKMFDKKNPKRLFSGALASILYDVLEDVIVDASFHPFLFSERKAALKHLELLKNLSLEQKIMVIFDRGYYSEEMYQYFVKNNIYCLFRIKERTLLAKNCNGDSILFTSGIPKKDLNPVKVRVVSVDLDSGIREYLVTNIFDTSIVPLTFKELYFKRWKVESKYYEIKELLLMEEFHGITSISIEQEFYINMMYSNLASFIKADADAEIQKKVDPENKYKYQANRIFLLGQIQKLLPKLILHCHLPDWLTILFHSAVRNRSQIQPDRKDERKRKRPNKRTHFTNRKTTT